ncbi:MAG: chemotaxis-specific protein-glutamate methyltransferase CheB [Desulfuromonadales bacterium]|nr:chemotaxis-specific protein-glutamate methyltransferase CheB [Desulfuromonadales bacterium]
MIRILIADDSELTRIVLRDLLSQDADFEIVGEVNNGRAAVEQTARLKPDLVIMDVMMPIMGGLEAVAEIMAATPTPILMLSANTDPQDSRSAFAAVKLGALDVMAKPSGVATRAFSQIASQLIVKVKSLSRIRVIHHYRAQRPKWEKATVPLPVGPRRILAIGASTGGPKAVLQLLQELPGDLDAAVLIVQHIADGFAPGFAVWLNRESALAVRLAEPGSELQPGTVLVAPNKVHLTIKSNRIVLENSPPLHNCRPAVDAMFHSLAGQQLAAETVAVLLTGMGTDGAVGLGALKKQGAYTIAQNEASCAIFGMPRAAIESGAVTRILPLEDIAEVVCRLFAR